MPRDYKFNSHSNGHSNGKGHGHNDHRAQTLFTGSNRDDTIEANDRSNLIFGRGGDDIILSGAGFDVIDGGRGTDTSVYSGSIDDYDIRSFGWGRFKTTIVTGPEGTDLLSDVEALHFEADDFTLWIDGTNNAVLAGDDAAATDEDTPLLIDAATLLANDREFDGDTIAITSVEATSALGATVSFDGTTVTYDPAIFASLAAGETIEDTFTYTVDDGKGGTDTATVTITVTGVNDAPVVTGNSVTLDENTTAVAAGVSATDAEGDAVTYSLSGADAALFTIDAATGEIAFLAAPDYETPLDADGDNAYELTIEATDGTDTGTADITVTVADVDEAPATAPRINEFHYDNASIDVGEFIEVRVAAGTDVTAMSVELYNGSNGALYNTLAVGSGAMTTDGTWDYHVLSLPTDGLQNGAPDGLALVDGTEVIEFLSYEGSFTATGGTASGLTSTDIGVAEDGSTPIGHSLQREDDGTWSAPEENTAGLDNNYEPPAEIRINEVHYDNTGADAGEFVEIRVTAGTDLTGYSVEFYNGASSQLSPYGSNPLSAATVTTDGTWDYYVIARAGIQNGNPDGIALLDADDAVVEFISYGGSFTPTSGAAAGLMSTDIGVTENSSTPVGYSLQRAPDGTWYTEGPATSGAANTAPPPAYEARINEFHYDDAGDDEGEFIEVRVTAGTDPSDLSIELYNGNGGGVYGTLSLPDTPASSDGTWDYYVVPAPGLQNGSPDGMALVTTSGYVFEFLSYEGTLTASGGTAAGMISDDIGVSENGEPEGLSLQRSEDGTWRGPEQSTAGASNDTPQPPQIVINEFMADPAAVDDTAGEWVELYNAGSDDVDINGWTIAGADGDSHVINAGGPLIVPAGGYVVLGNNADSTTNGGVTIDYEYTGFTLDNTADSIIVSDAGGAEIDRVDYDSTTFPLAEGSSTELIQPGLDNSFGTSWESPADSFGDGDMGTPGSTNITPQMLYIGEVQSTISASPYDGISDITVEAIVTFVTDDGFYLTEQTADWVNFGTASQGIYVYTGGGYPVAIGDVVTVTGTVDEYFGETQLTDVTNVSFGTPTMFTPIVTVELGPDAVNWEAYEGMYVAVRSATSDPLTITANFNLDRFGEISISAGTPIQPTQLYDAGSPEAEAAMAANANNSLLLSDGLSTQNPDEFIYIPNTGPGDNGNGYLDTGDDMDNSTAPRLGTEINEPVNGVMTYAFGSYALVVDGQLSLDEGSNPRPETPADVGGTLQVASVNVLNYFTSFTGGAGPNGAEVRGADNAEEFARQTDGLTAEILGTGAEVVALQELENNGFGSTSAIVTLTDELDAASGGTTNYQAVNPYDYITDPSGGAGWIGTDAITTGIIYDANAVTLVHAEVLVYEEASNAVTNAIAGDLATYIGRSWDDFDRNRPTVAATFIDEASGEEFTITSSHFKSKGDSGLQALADAAESWLASNPSDPDFAAVDALLQDLYADPNFDQGDGQGFWNQVRADAAVELADWIQNDYDGTGTTRVVYLGDMNSYAEEDAVQYLDDEAGLTDLIDSFIGQDQAYSYVFDGQAGTLDQALADDAMVPFVTGVTEWHINADEADLFNYDTSFNDPAFDLSGPYAASDHDPVIVGLDFGATLTT